MACCLTAPSHYLNQCWLIISKGEWHSSKGNFTAGISAINHCNWLEKFHQNLPGHNELNKLISVKAWPHWAVSTSLRNYHYKSKTVSRPYHLYSENPCTAWCSYNVVNSLPNPRKGHSIAWCVFVSSKSHLCSASLTARLYLISWYRWVSARET